MTQILSNDDFQSKSIYSDVCQNEAELEQIYKNSKKILIHGIIIIKIKLL